MPTKRTPINRPSLKRISPEAIAVFRRMVAVDHDTSDREWWEAHGDLCKALGSKPWEWPVVLNPNDECPFPPGCHAEEGWHRSRERRPEALALFADLTEAAKR